MPTFHPDETIIVYGNQYDGSSSFVNSFSAQWDGGHWTPSFPSWVNSEVGLGMGKFAANLSQALESHGYGMYKDRINKLLEKLVTTPEISQLFGDGGVWTIGPGLTAYNRMPADHLVIEFREDLPSQALAQTGWGATRPDPQALLPNPGYAAVPNGGYVTIALNMPKIQYYENNGYPQTFEATILHELMHPVLPIPDGYDYSVYMSSAATLMGFTNVGGISNDPVWRPVVLALDGNPVTLVDYLDSRTKFDVSGHGEPVKTGWFGQGDGVLFFDWDNSGIPSAGKMELARFGIDGGSDLQGLQAFDSNHNDLFDSGDHSWSEFKIWVDRDQNGKSAPKEIYTLSQLEIASISLSENMNAVSGRPVTDNVVVGSSLFTFSDGRLGEALDVGFYAPTSGNNAWIHHAGPTHYSIL